MNLNRWMYRNGRPNWLAKILNAASAFVYARGVSPNYLVTLEVVGRQSGKVVSLPLVMTVVDGERYLVSMLGEGVNWVRNVKAAGNRARLRHGVAEEVVLEEVAISRRAPILKAYLRHAPGARAHIPVNMDAPEAEFAAVAADYPVFQVVQAVAYQRSTTARSDVEPS